MEKVLETKIGKEKKGRNDTWQLENKNIKRRCVKVNRVSKSKIKTIISSYTTKKTIINHSTLIFWILISDFEF